ncbi:hypothetical protein D9613_007865 [Agrocybe pediades]|uniref:DUF1295-domain-containing protein n=1 Tax=Agrocybe pediades TaxID=84607 RepID=A0A8H4QNN3_9AGAR|nr:hypothetical protein D9613_007865 [Agrocybe pediades]KAF9561971.1 integral membrane protein [Agrocybe pediades]
MTLFNVPDYLDWPAQFCLLTTVVTWVASIVTSNVSQVDRLWTFLPTIYSAYFALLPALPRSQPIPFFPYAPKSLGWHALRDYSPRALLMLTVITIWMFRLSYNTYRRGLFSLKDEDYRWVVLRSQLHPALFQVVNLTFIAATQNVLLLLLGLPTYVASVIQPHTPLVASDFALAGIALAILAIEFTADNQQFSFHSYKHAYLAKEKTNLLAPVKPYNPAEQWPGARLAWTPDDANRGFVTRGLWRYSRHPNFACEQSFWWVITLFPLVAPSPPNPPRLSEIPTLKAILVGLMNCDLHKPLYASLKATFLPSLWYLIPAVSLSILFFSSTKYTEAISLSKYPEAYRAYQRRVGMFAPSHTLLKALHVKFFTSPVESQNIEKLVWGTPHIKKD